MRIWEGHDFVMSARSITNATLFLLIDGSD